MSNVPKENFSDVRRWQSWLDVEAALARVQARLGMIPKDAADQITAASDISRYDLDALSGEIEQTMSPVYSLSRQLANHSGAAGAWVHWGATTQNIIDAGRLLVLRDVQAQLKSSLGKTLVRMSKMAEEHADTVMIGRTNRQHALPITFGFKVGSWLDQLLRVCDQIEDCEPRLFQLRFGGAIGAFQSFGSHGPVLVKNLAEELGLRPAQYHGRAQTDVWVEYVSCLSMVGAAAYRVGNELFSLMQSELGEVAEDLASDVVGSSTMPHKVNPKYVVTLLANANALRGKAASAFGTTPPSHEGDAVTNRELRILVEDSCVLALEVVDGLHDLIEQVTLDLGKMQATLSSSGEMTALEGLMMDVAPQLGRAKAHDLLHGAAEKARATNTPLGTIVMELTEILDVVGKDALLRRFDPTQNTGCSRAIAIEMAQTARQRAASLTCQAPTIRNESATSTLASLQS